MPSMRGIRTSSSTTSKWLLPIFARALLAVFGGGDVKSFIRELILDELADVFFVVYG